MAVRFGSNCHPVAVPAVADDVDGDRRSDMLWRNDPNTDFAYWLMDGPQRVSGQGYSVGPNWNVVAKGDFNGDGQLDLVWSDGQSMQLWQRKIDGYEGLPMPLYPRGYRVVAHGDVNGDGKTDLLWRDADDRVLALWVMDGAQVVDSSSYGLSAGWRIAATGDLDGDRRLDLVLTNGARMDLWRGRRNLVWSAAAMGNFPVGWELTGTADMDGDGRHDLLWRHGQLGYFVYWRMVGPRRTYGREFLVDGTWRILKAGNFNSDGKADIVWTNGSLMQLWASGEGEGFQGLEMAAYPRGWTSR